jgi:BetI-type transcriptional repressor, C-terminal
MARGGRERSTETQGARYRAQYVTGTRRLESITTSAGQLTEMIAMTCLPDTLQPAPGQAPRSEWLLWLDLWALSPRNTGVTAVRRKFDERWRHTIEAIVLADQEAAEFTPTDADELATPGQPRRGSPAAV